MRAGRSGPTVFLMSLMFSAGCLFEQESEESGGTPSAYCIDETKPANMLIPEELAIICNNIHRLYASARSGESTGLSIESLCNITGLAKAPFAGNTVQACEMERDACLQVKYQQATGTGCPTQQDLAYCPATLAEIDACIAEDIKALQKAEQKAFEKLADFQQLTCNDVGRVDLTTAPINYATSYQTPEECQTLEQKCPGITAYF